jgi:hypothetical protein
VICPAQRAQVKGLAINGKFAVEESMSTGCQSGKRSYM